MKQFLLIFSAIIVSASCQQVKDKSHELVDKAKTKAGEAWKKKVNETFDALTTTKSSSFSDVFDKPDDLKIEEIDGTWIDWPAGFYYGFLKYKGNKQAVLDFIIAQPERKGYEGSGKWTKNNGADMLENLVLIEKDHPVLKKDLEFFYEIRNIKGLEYYQCDRFPKTHYIAYDPKTGVFYHHFENSAG